MWMAWHPLGRDRSMNQRTQEKILLYWDHPRLGPAEKVAFWPPGINHSRKSGLLACLPAWSPVLPRHVTVPLTP